MSSDDLSPSLNDLFRTKAAQIASDVVDEIRFNGMGTVAKSRIAHDITTALQQTHDTAHQQGREEEREQWKIKVCDDYKTKL